MAEDIAPEARKGPTLERLKRMFSEAQDLTAVARTEALTDLDYYHNKQWSSAEKRALSDRGQPDTQFNRINPAVNGIVGVVERGKSEPRAFPRTPGDEESADVATDTLRYIADWNRLHRIKQDCFLDMLIPGTMAAMIGVDADNQVLITQIRWEEFFADPRARRPDFKDARYLGVAKWMYADDVAGMYPEKTADIERTVDAGPMVADTSFMDRPSDAQGSSQWVDRRQRRLLVIELYYRDAGAWGRCVFTADTVMEEGESPYLDHKGRPDCPIEAHSAYVDRENNRYGAVRAMRGPQDEINKRRSKLLHLLSVSQIQAVDPIAIDVDADVARKEAARPDGVIPIGWNKVSTSDMAMGQRDLLQEAKAEIERMGPNPAVLGRDNADASGRALLARQQSGLVELAHLYGGLEDWELRIYRQCWSRAKQYWTAPQFVRVTDDQDAPKFVGINQPMMGPAQVVTDPATGAQALQPTVLGYKNQLAEMDVDIILDTVQDIGTARHEQFNALMQLLGSNPAWAAQVPFDVALQLSDIPHKRDLMDKLKKSRDEAMQAQAQAQQIAQAAALADLKKTQSETQLNEVTGKAKVADTIIKAHTAHADNVSEGFTTGFEAAQPLPAAGEPQGAPGVSASSAA